MCVCVYGCLYVGVYYTKGLSRINDNIVEMMDFNLYLMVINLTVL